MTRFVLEYLFKIKPLKKLTTAKDKDNITPYILDTKGKHDRLPKRDAPTAEQDTLHGRKGSPGVSRPWYRLPTKELQT